MVKLMGQEAVVVLRSSLADAPSVRLLARARANTSHALPDEAARTIILNGKFRLFCITVFYARVFGTDD